MCYTKICCFSGLIFLTTNKINLVNYVIRCADDKPLMQTFQVSKEKAKTLGVEFIPLEVSLKEIVESFKDKKFANF